MDMLNTFKALNTANGEKQENDASTQDLVGDSHVVFDGQKGYSFTDLCNRKKKLLVQFSVCKQCE